MPPANRDFFTEFAVIARKSRRSVQESPGATGRGPRKNGESHEAAPNLPGPNLPRLGTRGQSLR